MSFVSSLILQTASDEKDAIDQLNAWLEKDHKPPLKSITELCGGNKYMQIAVYGGAFNYLDEEAFVAAFKACEFENPGKAILTINPEEGATRVWRAE